MSRSSRDWRPYLILLLTAVIVYWPLSFGIYSLKNDALIYFLPWRFHISEAVQSGHFPFWSPYLYTGMPLASDMQSGAWNPLVLLLSFFTRYNMQVLQWELLFYLFISGAGMYRLIREAGYTKQISLLAGITYMCCGFMTDSGSFIPWITCAAWLPFVSLYFYRLLKNPIFFTSLKLGLFLFLLFTAGYPAFFIFTCYLLFAIVICRLVKDLRAKTKWQPYIKFGLISIIVFGLLSAPAIISYTSFIQYYQRGQGASLEAALTNPFPPFSSVSFLLPQAVAKPHEWIRTDLAMRNGYVGIFTILFFVLALTRKLNSFQKIVLGITIFSFLFSLGEFTPVRKWCYMALPGMDSFRHPGVIRLFTSMGIIMLAAGALQDFFSGNIEGKKIRALILVFGSLLIGLLVYCIMNGGSNFNASGTIKQVLDQLTFPNIGVFLCLVQLLFLGLFFSFHSRKRLTSWILVLNVTLLAIASLPFTFISQMKTGDLDRFINTSKRGYPEISANETIDAGRFTDTAVNAVFGDTMFYNKKVRINDNIVNPTVSKDYLSFLSDSSRRKHMDRYPVAYIASEGYLPSIKPVGVHWVSSNEFYLKGLGEINVQSEVYVFQQFHHGWRAWANKSTVQPEKANGAFMKVKVPPGTGSVRFWFVPGGNGPLTSGFNFQVLMFLSGLLLLYIIASSCWFYWLEKT